MTPAPITPLDRGEIKHTTAYKHEQESGGDGQHVVEREACNNVSHAQKLIEPSPLRPHTTMAIEKVNVAQRAAQPTVISMAMQKVCSECNQPRGAN